MRFHPAKLPIAKGNWAHGVTEELIRQLGSHALLEDIAERPDQYSRCDVARLIRRMCEEWAIWLLEVERTTPGSFRPEEEVVREKLVDYRLILAFNGFAIQSEIPLHHAAHGQLLELRGVLARTIEDMTCQP